MIRLLTNLFLQCLYQSMSCFRRKSILSAPCSWKFFNCVLLDLKLRQSCLVLLIRLINIFVIISKNFVHICRLYQRVIWAQITWAFILESRFEVFSFLANCLFYGTIPSSWVWLLNLLLIVFCIFLILNQYVFRK